MDSIRQYLLSIIAAAIICGVAVSLMHKKCTQASILKLLTGIFMAITIIAPLTKFDFTNLQDFTIGFSTDAQNAVAIGKEFADCHTREIITQQVEAYIQEKAKTLGADLTIDAELSGEDPPVPQSVTICGAVSPYAKSVLCRYIESNLAIPEENQTWI